MSRIGKLPVEIPEKVTVTLDGNHVKVEGPKGTLEKNFDRTVKIEMSDDGVKVSPANNSRLARSMYGTARSIINNMVTGVTNGYSKELEIQGTGFRAALSGNNLNLNLGYSHEINYTVPTGINITVTDNTKIKVEGADKHMVGQVAADIKHYYPVEPYKGKGVRILGEYVRRKEGKKTA